MRGLCKVPRRLMVGGVITRRTLARVVIGVVGLTCVRLCWGSCVFGIFVGHPRKKEGV